MPSELWPAPLRVNHGRDARATPSNGITAPDLPDCEIVVENRESKSSNRGWLNNSELCLELRLQVLPIG